MKIFAHIFNIIYFYILSFKESRREKKSTVEKEKNEDLLSKKSTLSKERYRKKKYIHTKIVSQEKCISSFKPKIKFICVAFFISI